VTRKPVIQRSMIYNALPQSPDWFCNLAHINAKWRFLRKIRSRYRMETLRACPHCGGGDFTLLSTQERSGLPTSVVICRDCALVFTNPRLGADALGDHYAKDYREIERGDIPDIHRFMFNLQKSKAPGIATFLKDAGNPIAGGARVTDIGCGEGGLLAGLAEENPGIRVVGYELNTSATSYGRDQGMDIRTAYFDGAGEAYDYVILEQTLEHLPDPSALLASIARNQKPGGVLYIGVPGILAYPQNYQNNFVQYLQYGHLFHYTLHTLERLVVRFGYRLAYGTETIQAAFVRVDSASRQSVPAQDAEQIVALLQKAEVDFNAQGSHFLKNWRNYLRYALRWALCAIYPIKRQR
jgi:2-polyprenyl-3-methyl-5-hydroxy-6-metoxy-1,4-benzoquinol methylase